MKVDDFLQKVLDRAHTKEFSLKQSWFFFGKNDERNDFAVYRFLSKLPKFGENYENLS